MIIARKFRISPIHPPLGHLDPFRPDPAQTCPDVLQADPPALADSPGRRGQTRRSPAPATYGQIHQLRRPAIWATRLDPAKELCSAHLLHRGKNWDAQPASAVVLCIGGWSMGRNGGEEVERNGEDSELGRATVEKLDADRNNYGRLPLACCYRGLWAFGPIRIRK